jgi:tRNA threonylcarbamoyladenosine biosynthesis protein TsaB
VIVSLEPPIAGTGTARASGSTRAILAIETSTPVARVVVVDQPTGNTLAAAEAVAERHSSNLLRLCAEVTLRAGVAVTRLGAIACGRGPGSFTGLRVGLAVAKGLAMPTGVPLVLVSSLEALAMDMLSLAPANEQWLLPCLDAGKGQIFAALFERRGDREVIARSDDWASAPHALPSLVFDLLPTEGGLVWGGPGAVRYQEILAQGLGPSARFVQAVGPTARAVATRALEKLRLGHTDDLGAAVPAYGRAPDITSPKRPLR